MAFEGIENIKFEFSHTEDLNTKLLPVNHQIRDGTCFAVHASELMGIMYSLNNSNPHIPLSSQELVDWIPARYPASYEYNSRAIFNSMYGLYNLEVAHVLDYLMDDGICEAAQYPYIAERNPPERRIITSGMVKYRCKRWELRPFQLKTPQWVVGKLADHPLLGIVYVNDIFLNLGKGEIYRGPREGEVLQDEEGNDVLQVGIFSHAVLVTGYGMVNKVPCIEVKNSWGTVWGNNGYGLVCFKAIQWYVSIESVYRVEPV